jgi:hypothetical protein
MELHRPTTEELSGTSCSGCLCRPTRTLRAAARSTGQPAFAAPVLSAQSKTACFITCARTGARHDKLRGGVVLEAGEARPPQGSHARPKTIELPIDPCSLPATDKSDGGTGGAYWTQVWWPARWDRRGPDTSSLPSISNGQDDGSPKLPFTSARLVSFFDNLPPSTASNPTAIRGMDPNDYVPPQLPPPRIVPINGQSIPCCSIRFVDHSRDVYRACASIMPTKITRRSQTAGRPDFLRRSAITR